MKYIAYYRVSTARQGVSGLGLEAQERDVLAYIRGNELLASYTDIESGSKNNRPQLIAALAHCQQSGATLIIAKLDRLSRNSAFIGMLMESKMQFVCCDMPDATPLTLHIFAAIAQHEREMISNRVKAGLKSAKIRGVKLGNPKADHKHMDKMRANKKPRPINSTVKFICSNMRANNSPLHEIAQEINKQGFKTFHGKQYSAVSVHRILQKLPLI